MTTPIDVPALDERYVTGREIERRGIVVVYAGVDNLLHRRVTVTVLAPRSATDASSVSKRYRKADGILRLDHPNVAALYEAGRRGDEFYFTSEFVEGRTLAEIRESGESLSESVVRSYAAQIGGAIAYARAKGVELDVRPEAVYVTPDGIVKIDPLSNISEERESLAPLSTADEVIEALSSTTGEPPARAHGDDAATFMMDAIASRFSKGPGLPSWDESPPRRFPVRAIGGAILVLLLVAGAIAATTQFAVLLDVNGMSQSQAQEALLDDGFRVTIVPRASTLVLPQHIVEQQPAPGRWLRKGGEVILTVSSGLPAILTHAASPRRPRKNRLRSDRPPAPRIAPIALRPRPHVPATTLPRSTKSACPAANVVHANGLPPGCLDPSIASSGELLRSMGTGITVPVTSLRSPGEVMYARAYIKPASGPKRFVGILSGNGRGTLIVRVQNGMFVEQNGSHATYSIFDGERLTGVQETPAAGNSPGLQSTPKTANDPQCSQAPWLRRTLHQVFGTTSRPCT